ncbi:hypothetical protein JCM17846_14280 [Iodidimonas nitroreducens]|uniref:ABC transmembrane type-1 domain-containing protein n=2 Tax=Iodidimonas nitroreducens TaxID=1236968 RepID=A0A5A7N9T9_9PROT|nr:hypothetical protein JCM17846_14280 [Iodidimonas nitroreducens]
METLADFGAVSYFGVQSFTTGIYRAWFSFGDRVVAAQLASLLLGFVVLLLFLEKTSRRGARYYQTSQKMRSLNIQRLTGLRGWLAAFLCALPFFAGFLLPVLILLHLAYAGGDAQFGHRYLDLAEKSISLALITALLAVMLALLISYARRTDSTPLSRTTSAIAGIGYAIPGSIIAVGVLIPFAWFDNKVDAFFRSSFDYSTGLLLTGSIAALIFAYLVRFLALAQQTTWAGLLKITPSMDAAAASLGVGRFEALRRVHMPLLKAPLLTAGLLVFVEVMKELPATLIMRPFNFDTLAVQAHNLAADERLAEAATPALTIVLVGLLPVIILTRLISRSRPGHAPMPRKQLLNAPPPSLIR